MPKNTIIVPMGIELVIVDDAPFIREVLRHIVSGTEIRVVAEAGDGEEAVEVVHAARPHVVLMDIVMPHKSGVVATQEILEAHPDIAIIACSTVDQETMVMRALEAGCTHYLVKPFKKEEVLRAIRSAVGQAGKQESE